MCCSVQFNWTLYLDHLVADTNVTLDFNSDPVMVMDINYLQKLSLLISMTPQDTLGTWQCSGRWGDLACISCLWYSVVYRIYVNIPRIFFPEFSEEKLGCVHYLKQGWYSSACKQMILSRIKEWSANHVLSRLLLQDLVIARSRQKKSLV